MLTRELQLLVKQSIARIRDSSCTFGAALLTQSDPITVVARIHGPTANVIPPSGHDREEIYQNERYANRVPRWVRRQAKALGNVTTTRQL